MSISLNLSVADIKYCHNLHKKVFCNFWVPSEWVSDFVKSESVLKQLTTGKLYLEQLTRIDHTAKMLAVSMVKMLQRISVKRINETNQMDNMQQSAFSLFNFYTANYSNY